MRPTTVTSQPSPGIRPPLRGVERGPYLIVSTPVLEVLADLERRVALLAECDPNGAAHHTLKLVVSALGAALRQGEETNTWGNIEYLHELTGRPKSTITEWAQKYGKDVWCWKRSGVWAVDINKFDTWYRTSLPQLLKRERKGRPAQVVTVSEPSDVREINEREAA
jgi:hypothetical protein